MFGSNTRAMVWMLIALLMGFLSSHSPTSTETSGGDFTVHDETDGNDMGNLLLPGPVITLLWSFVAFYVSALTGTNSIGDIMVILFFVSSAEIFFPTLFFMLALLVSARAFHLAENCLRTTVQFTKTRHFVTNMKTRRYKAKAKALRKQLRETRQDQANLAVLACGNDIRARNTATNLAHTIDVLNNKVLHLKRENKALVASTASAKNDLSHYMWFSERTIDFKAGRIAQLDSMLLGYEDELAACRVKVEDSIESYDQLHANYVITVRDCEKRLEKHDDENDFLRQENLKLHEANESKDEAIERLQAQLARLEARQQHAGSQDKYTSSPSNGEGTSTCPPTPSFHSRCGSTDADDDDSIFGSADDDSSTRSETSVATTAGAEMAEVFKGDRKVTDMSAATIGAAAAGHSFSRKAEVAVGVYAPPAQGIFDDNGVPDKGVWTGVDDAAASTNLLLTAGVILVLAEMDRFW